MATGVQAASTDVVLYSSDAVKTAGNWARVAEKTAASGQELSSADKGWSSTDAALASPVDYIEFTFNAPASTPHRVWVRMRAAANNKYNDSIFVQFSDAVNGSGAPLYRMGTTNALTLNLAQSANGKMNGWGWIDGGWAPLSRALNAGRAGAAAELVGVAAGASDMTFDYLKQRKQFGKLIGEFQALQHRAAHLYGEIEIARAAALKAAELLDAGSDRAELMVAVAKAKAGRSAALAVQEGVQMHGGIGMTDEHDIGLYMKREAMLSELFGSPRFHANRVAELSGY